MSPAAGAPGDAVQPGRLLLALLVGLAAAWSRMEKAAVVM